MNIPHILRKLAKNISEGADYALKDRGATEAFAMLEALAEALETTAVELELDPEKSEEDAS